MASLAELFKPDEMGAFAYSLQRDLGIRVVFKGRNICSDFECEPPVIFLPSMERAREEDVKIIQGFALHEAAHARWTEFHVLENIKDYATKTVHHAIEDEMVERKLEMTISNARTLLKYSLQEGAKRCFEGRQVVMPVRDGSFLTQEGEAKVKAMMEQARIEASIPFDVTDKNQVGAIQVNLEISRCSALWYVKKRAYGFILFDWTCVGEQGPIEPHPWYSIFEEETRIPARSSSMALGQAERIVKRICVEACPLGRRPLPLEKKIMTPFADFSRPVSEAKEKMKEAENKEKLAQEARVQLASMYGKRNAETQRLIEESDFVDKVDDARVAAQDAEAAYRKARKILAAIRRKTAKIRKFERRAKRGLGPVRKELKDAEKAYKLVQKVLDKALKDEEKAPAGTPEIERLNGQLEAMRLRVETAQAQYDHAASVLESRQALSTKQKDLLEAYIKESAEAMQYRDETADEYARINGEFEAEKNRITQEVVQRWAPVIEPLERDANNADERARRALQKANEILSYIKMRDDEVEAQVASGAKEYLVKGAFELYKKQDLSEEVKLATNAEDVNATLDDKLVLGDPDVPVRKYTPYSRCYDVVEKVEATPDNRATYDDTAREVEKIVEETAENLSRLYSPAKVDVQTNRRRGVIDPRKITRLALAQAGANVDTKKVWKDIKVEKTPKVAISILLDCSHSMNSVEKVSPRAALTDAGEWAVPIHEEDPNGQYTFEELNAGLYIVQTGETSFLVKTTDEALDFKGSGRSAMGALRDFQKDIQENGHTRWKVAQKAAVALAEVCKRLNIPCEVLGHTTNTNMVPSLDIDEDVHDLSAFSRFAPFKGLKFKEADEKTSPASIFAALDMQDNLDGEGILWQAQRLTKRRERTKILIVLSDGFPAAHYSHEGELQRHLYTVCKMLETHSSEGLYLWGIGCKSERVKDFFKNASVLNDVNDLPKATLAAVEEILINIVGSMG